MVSADFLEAVFRYLDGRSDLAALETWFLPRVFDLIADRQSDDARLAGAVQLCLAEMQDGILTEDEAREDLRGVLRELGITWGERPGELRYDDNPSATVTTTSSYASVHASWDLAAVDVRITGS